MVRKIRRKFKDKSFGRIKSICLAKSYLMAREASMIKNINSEAQENITLSTLCDDLSRLREQIEKIANNYGIKEKKSVVHSGQQTEGEYTDIYVFYYSFTKKAPELLKLANEIASKIDFKVTGKSQGIVRGEFICSDELELPRIFVSAVYGISSDSHYIMDSKVGKIIHRPGKMLGLHSINKDNHALSFSVESHILLDHLIEEIIHAKVPRRLQHKHENISRTRIYLTNLLLESGVDRDLEEPTIKEEKKSIIKDFKSFDNDLKRWFSSSKVMI